MSPSHLELGSQREKSKGLILDSLQSLGSDLSVILSEVCMSASGAGHGNHSVTELT